MAFSWHTTHYPTLADYQAALLPFPKPDWISGLTVHHTYRPTADQWRGARTMAVLERFYRAKGWSGGPHLFLAPDGIWAGTPLADQGVHAGRCNSDHIGLEIVGDFDAEPWPFELRARVYGLVTLLCQWGRILPGRIHGHRECLANKTCPGAAISMAQVRLDIATRLASPTRLYRVTSTIGANVRAAPSADARKVAALPYDRQFRGVEMLGEAPVGKTDRRWIKSDEAGGYIWRGIVVPVSEAF